MAASALEERVRHLRAQAAIRDWEYRQRRHAKGVWFRLRRVLADAQECWQIPPGEVPSLLDEGFEAQPVGHEIEPPLKMFILPAARVAVIRGRRRIAVGLTAALLGAGCVALVPFAPAMPPPPNGETGG